MSISELTLVWIGDLNHTSEFSMHYFLRVKWTEQLSSYEHLYCAVYAVCLALLRIFMKTCAECVTNTTEFILVNVYLIKRRPAFVSAHSLYPALRVVSVGLQPSGGAQVVHRPRPVLRCSIPYAEW
jgi:hypothetical protein